MTTRRLVPAIGWPISDAALGENWRIGSAQFSYISLPTETLVNGILRDTNINLARLCYVFKVFIIEQLYDSLPAGASPTRAYEYNAGSYLFLIDEPNQEGRFNANVPGLPQTNRFSGMLFINLLPPRPDDAEGRDWDELIEIYAITVVRSTPNDGGASSDQLRIFRLVSRGAPDDVDWDEYPLAHERDLSTTFELNMWTLFSSGSPQRTFRVSTTTMLARAIAAGNSIARILNVAYHYWATRLSTVRRIHGRLLELPEIEFVIAGIHRSYYENRLALTWLRGFIRVLRGGVQAEIDDAMFMLGRYILHAETRQSVTDIIRRDYGLQIMVTDRRLVNRRIRNGIYPGATTQPRRPPPRDRDDDDDDGGSRRGATSGATQSTNTSIRIVAPVRNTLIRRGLRSTYDDK